MLVTYSNAILKVTVTYSNSILDGEILKAKTKLFLERTKRQLTQNQVAINLGITRSGYSLIENGHRNPSWAVAQRLEQFFGIPISNLLAEWEGEDD